MHKAKPYKRNHSKCQDQYKICYFTHYPFLVLCIVSLAPVLKDETVTEIEYIIWFQQKATEQ
jgi:hypothetical protein